VSTALIDGEITPQEFTLVLDEMSKYQQMKKEIRDGARTAHDVVGINEQIKNKSIKQGHNQARVSFMKKTCLKFSVICEYGCQKAPDEAVVPTTPPAYDN